MRKVRCPLYHRQVWARRNVYINVALWVLGAHTRLDCLLLEAGAGWSNSARSLRNFEFYCARAEIRQINVDGVGEFQRQTKRYIALNTYHYCVVTVPGIHVKHEGCVSTLMQNDIGRYDTLS